VIGAAETGLPPFPGKNGEAGGAAQQLGIETFRRGETCGAPVIAIGAAGHVLISSGEEKPADGAMWPAGRKGLGHFY
jgi:hypothetical protein